MFRYFFIISTGFLVHSNVAFAQPSSPAADGRLQYSRVLSNSFFGVTIGYINYPFSQQQLEEGWQAGSVHVPHAALRITLFGHEFNKYLSAQISYMRPVDWVAYKNINGDNKNHTVWMNEVGLTAKMKSPGWKKFSLYAEGGIVLVTRRGFFINNSPVVRHANFITASAGAGLQYHVNNKWAFIFNTVYSPAAAKYKQPHTVFYSAGFAYTMRPLAAETIRRNVSAGYIFPKSRLQVGYTTNSLGYGVNRAVSKDVPVFWGGEAKVKQGFSIHYQQNIFHTRKVFSFDWGASFGYWQSRKNRNEFITLSLFPLLRFTVARMRSADLYLEYSVAGPTYISRTMVDDESTGKHFTFQDFMGIGFDAGKKRNINAAIRIAHYSNGNIFPENTGIMIPLTFNIGWTFNK